MAVSKRVVDLLVGLVLVVLTLPLLVLLLAGSAVAYRTNPIFVQRRMGHDGKLFWFVKVRSLPAQTSTTAHKYELALVLNSGWGRFLRKFHLDELPQFWLVVFGTMSLVGPRPEMPTLAATFDSGFVSERVSMRPGCTGLWQISEASAKLIGEAPEYDLHYVQNWTLRLDLWILVYTALEIVVAPSIAGLDRVPAWTGADVRQPGAVLAWSTDRVVDADRA